MKQIIILCGTRRKLDVSSDDLKLHKYTDLGLKNQIWSLFCRDHIWWRRLDVRLVTRGGSVGVDASIDREICTLKASFWF